ncbi:uncharacterized protein LOC120149523 [Hibiscus syriacus]|uniref:uncharacterized protein LOC120149523 n=1 Tax=Hibiscus syriacus TaxID=106335 RepID=UPI0019216FB6|nr:uncharacterized protein LOC120149523 [Hibiscus syriacus]
MDKSRINGLNYGQIIGLSKSCVVGARIPILTDTNELRIPTLTVDDWTERKLRNYIAHERFISSDEPAYFSDYALFTDNLISTSKDVQLLRKKGIIDNWLGDDESVANMINRLQNSVVMSDHFYYAEMFERVNEHCQKRRHKWKAALNKNYFNSPWSLISFLAATVVVLLAIVQTIFPVLSHLTTKIEGKPVQVMEWISSGFLLHW